MKTILTGRTTVFIWPIIFLLIIGLAWSAMPTRSVSAGFTPTPDSPPPPPPPSAPSDPQDDDDDDNDDDDGPEAPKKIPIPPPLPTPIIVTSDPPVSLPITGEVSRPSSAQSTYSSLPAQKMVVIIDTSRFTAKHYAGARQDIGFHSSLLIFRPYRGPD